MSSPPVANWTNELPSLNGLRACSSDVAGIGLSAVPITAGWVYLILMPVPAPISVTTIWINVAVGGTGSPTLANCYMGIYNNAGTRIATTADQSSNWNTNGVKNVTLTADGGKSITPLVAPAGFIYGAFLVGTQSGTPLTMNRIGGTISGNINSSLREVVLTGSLSALPSSVNMGSVGATSSIWIGLS
jgi:hypothetical protein